MDVTAEPTGADDTCTPGTVVSLADFIARRVSLGPQGETHMGTAWPSPSQAGRLSARQIAHRRRMLRHLCSAGPARL